MLAGLPNGQPPPLPPPPVRQQQAPLPQHALDETPPSAGEQPQQEVIEVQILPQVY